MLVLGYVALLAWLIYSLPFFSHNGIRQHTPVLLFLVKVFFGLTYSYIYLNHYNGGDALHYFRDG